MRSLVAAVLAGVVAATPLSVQGRGATEASPFSAVALRRAVAQAPQSAKPSRVNTWTHLRTLEPARDVRVAIEGRGNVERTFVAVHDDELVLLADRDLPAPVRRVYRDLIRQSPQEFRQVATTQRHEAGRVRIGPDGVFYEGRNVADAVSIVEQVPREDVAEVSVAAGDTRAVGFVVGGALMVTGGVINGVTSHRACGCSDVVPTVGGLAFTLAGLGVLIAAARSPKPEPGARSTVYRRP